MFKGDSSWNIFQQSKCSLLHDVESNCEEVSSVKKVAKNVRSSVLDSIHIKVRNSSKIEKVETYYLKSIICLSLFCSLISAYLCNVCNCYKFYFKTTNTIGRNAKDRKKGSVFWEVGNIMGTSANELSHEDSPMKALLESASDVMKSLAEAHLQLEENVIKNLGPDTPISNLITKDYVSLQKDKELLRNKQKELERVNSRYTKEKDRGPTAKEQRTKEELDLVNRDSKILADKVTAEVYCLQANEWEYTENLLKTMESLEQFFRQGSLLLTDILPTLRTKLKESPKQKVYGTDLIQHLK